MSEFEESRERTAKAAAKKRERDRQKKLEHLMQIEDEATFRVLLSRDYGIDEGHGSFAACIDAWRSKRS